MFVGFNSRSSRFFQRLCLGFSKIFLGSMAGVWMDGFFWYLMTILAVCLGYSLAWAGEVFCFFERYLVAKIRTIFSILVWMVFFIKRD